MSTCKARREGDEMNCTRCGYFWDVDDSDPPKCKTKNELLVERNKRHLSDIRGMLRK